jgi:hypothetical protein
MKTPTPEQLELAIEWLEANEGLDGEAETCAAVAAWLRHQQGAMMEREAMRIAKRRMASKLGISVAHLERCRKGIDQWPRNT